MPIAARRWLIAGIAVVVIGAGLAAVRHHWTKIARVVTEREPARVSEQAGSTAVRMVTPSITPARRGIVDAQLPAFDPDQEVEVPFTRFVTESGKARLLFLPRELRSTLEIDGIGRIVFPRSGVPLKLVEMGNGIRAVFFREMFSGRLYLYRVGAGIEQETYVKGPGDAELILREAVAFQGKLHVIVYDNERGVNEVVAIDPGSLLGEWAPSAIAVLPTLEDPAGTHYEMMPTLFMYPRQDHLYIIGGTLLASLDTSGAQKAKAGPQSQGNNATSAGLTNIRRLEGCIRAQEAIAGPSGIAILCLRKNGRPQSFQLTHWAQNGKSRTVELPKKEGLPWRLRWEGNEPVADTADTFDRLADVLRHDLEHNQVSGAMELGTNNLEGRVAWSQIYFLNGLLDLVKLARSDDAAFTIFEPLVAAAKRRADIEFYLLDRLMQSDVGYLTKAFTVHREPALFAVQTSRLLLLFNRYAKEITQGAILGSHAPLARKVLTLDGHIDVMRQADTRSKEPRPGRHFIAWPKGSAFYFDGLNVPYNHQNEWAYAVFDTVSAKANPSSIEQQALVQAAEIINHFVEAIAPQGEMPASGEWPYWWGRARDGWAEADAPSKNMKSYSGDTSIAFISFRSIDVMSVISATQHAAAAARPRLLESFSRLTARGHVYPFVSSALLSKGAYPHLNRNVAFEYARLTAPWDLQSAVWALLSMPVGPPLEDPHSRGLNSQVLAKLPGIAKVRPTTPGALDTLIDYLRIAIPYNAELAWRHAGLELGGKFLAWNLAYDIDAAVAAFERTGDRRLIPILDHAFDVALRMRDDRVGRKDDVRGRIMPAWGSNRYNPGKKDWMAWDAFTGMIAYPGLVYARLLRDRFDLPEQAAGAKRLEADLRTAVDAFDDWWRIDEESGEGYYFDPLYQDVAPLNHMNLLGLAHIELCTNFASPASCKKAFGLASFFRRHLKRANDGTCSWEYWAGATLPAHRSTAGEDITHAHINVRFAHLAYEHSIVFDRSDMGCMARTMTQKVMRPTGDWAMAVDGTGNLVESKLHEGLSAWAQLEAFDPTIGPKIEEFMMGRPDAYPLGWMSYASGPGSFARKLPAASKPQ
jgi:hypothetical protein